MLKQDIEFVEHAAAIKKEFDCPKAIHASWAKNTGKTFFQVAEKMRQAGLQTAFTLALQSLGDQPLTLMQRKNMKVNEWEELADWLIKQGFDLYAELIWGVPGETYESFIEGYDRLAEKVSRITIYGHLLIPNTEFTENRSEHGFVTVRGEVHDFEYVIAHNTMTIADNIRAHRFIFWARVLADFLVFRRLWFPLRKLINLPQSKSS